MHSKLRYTVASTLIALVSTTMPAATNAPKVTGPIPASAAPGDPSHNYPYFTTSHLVAKHGYVEEEFYLEGLAVEYAGEADRTATVAPGGPYPYKTRLIARRPKSSGKFNGTVIVEVNNTAAGRDIENEWYWSHEHLMRRGFAHVGVSVHSNGIDNPQTGLKRWNPARYGTLDATGNGKFSNNELSFSILTQLAQALRIPSALLGNFKVRNVIAGGHSQSAGRLFQYYNRIQPLERAFDGFVLHGAGALLRSDVATPVFKLLAETDVILRQASLRQPDSNYIRTWEVAGASHADWDLHTIMELLETRDLGSIPVPLPCERPPLSRVPSRLVLNAVYDRMKLWVERRTPPPVAERIVVSSIGAGDQLSVIERNEFGLARGGIRLAQLAVPMARNTGLNSGPGMCRQLGSHEPIDETTLLQRHPTRSEYLSDVQRITEVNLKSGFITKEGAAQTKTEAAQVRLKGW
ncbi:MAG TPA: alpha/beta hydrolase domain-containing protein [Terriglobia bacterium]|nr:alpha/beta hydrolase domain-containing protein [Terriglobia bacterium]